MYVVVIGIIIGFKAPVSALITFIVVWPILIFTVVGLIAWKLFFTSGTNSVGKDSAKKDSNIQSSKQQPNGNPGQSTLSELQKIGLKIAMFLVILGIIFVTKWFFKSQGGVVNVTKDIFVGAKTPAQITADSLHQIDIDIANAKKARSRAEDQLIAEEGGVFGSVAAGLFGKQIFRGKSDSQESEDSEDLTNSVPSKNNDRNSNSSHTSVPVPDPAVIAEQERMRKLFEHQNTDPQGNPIVPVAYPGSQ
jgi:hypothetical protein